MKTLRIMVVVAVLMAVAFPLTGDEMTAKEAAKASQNPVANVISVPMQANVNFGVGLADETQWVNLWQPVIPHGLGKHLNLIHRIILPLPVYQPVSGGVWGLGDIQYEGFISPADPGAVIWGIGPYINFPTATNPALGTGKWSIGPALLLLAMPGSWVFGGLVTQLWSFAGDASRNDVSQMSIQYFINYNIPKSGGWYLTTSPTMTANWKASSGQQWTIPVGGGIGKMTLIGKGPKKTGLDAKIQFFGYVLAPSGGPSWGMQIQIKTLFPK